jgi:hypothetical protein
MTKPMTSAEARRWARSAEQHNEPAKAAMWIRYAQELEAAEMSQPRPLDGKMKAAGE